MAFKILPEGFAPLVVVDSKKRRPAWLSRYESNSWFDVHLSKSFECRSATARAVCPRRMALAITHVTQPTMPKTIATVRTSCIFLLLTRITVREGGMLTHGAIRQGEILGQAFICS